MQHLDQYDYSFPSHLIAQAPAHPRDHARLLVYNRAQNTIAFDTFMHIDQYVPKNTVLVLNQTKVVPARIIVTKPTGGKAALLYTSHTKNTITVLSNRKLNLGLRLHLTEDLWFTVTGQKNNHYQLIPSFPIAHLFTILEKYGQTPIPPYIKHSPLSEKKLRTEYQAVFAKIKGSVAAPTASLHFTRPLLARLKQKGIQVEYITLHVNLGTFASLTEEQLKTGKLHEEHYEISPTTAKRLNAAKHAGKPIIAVGTTVVRTLESAVQKSVMVSLSNHDTKNQKSSTETLRQDQGDNEQTLTNLSGMTDLFMYPPYTPTFVDGLITNFHVPRSSLLMLVATFIGREKLLELYTEAIQNEFRLFSFGDGMLII